MMLPPLPSLAEVIEQAPDAILLVDKAGTVVYANRRIEALFGMAPDDLRGQPVETLLPEALRGVHEGHRRAYAQAPRVRPMGDNRLALAGRRADGTRFPVDIHLAPVRGEGQHAWTLAVIRDATERHQFVDALQDARQAAEQVARLKGEFLAVAAHDLSQPQQTLEMLIGMIERRVPPGSEVAELAQEATASLERMRELLKMLIEISSLESGALRVAAEPVRVTEVFDALERQFAPAARAKALRLASDPCSHVVETDPALLRGLLTNLVSNAIRYTRQGEVLIRCVAPSDGTLRLAVVDTGIGIPGDQLRSIFDDFRRLEAGQCAHRDGFGLGLGIVRRLSTLLQLPVSVQSVVGHGSTFNVEFPAAKVFHAA